MDEYINANDLREKINAIREKDYIYLKSAYIDGMEQRADTILDFIDEMVSANGIKIIHCKDCMYFRDGMCVQEDIRYGYVCGDNTTTWIQSPFEPDEDFWCKYGEREYKNNK